MTERSGTGINAPLAMPALFLAAGIGAARFTSYNPTDLTVYATLAVALLLNIRLLSSSSQLPKHLSLAAVFFMIGMAVMNRAEPSPLPEEIQAIAAADRDTVFTGTLLNAPSYNGYRGSFLVETDQLKRGETTIPFKSRILLKTPFQPPGDLTPGKRLLIRASLSDPAPSGIPGGFDYRRFLADRGIGLTGFIRSPVYIRAEKEPPSFDNLRTMWIYPQYLRHKINLFIDGADLPLQTKALYKAIITGQRDSVPTEVIDHFKRSGAIHLLAISGMHLGLLALLSGLFFNFILRRSTTLMLRWPAWKIAALSTLPVMGGYALISGLQPPVVRAFIMASTLIGAVILDRPRSLLNALGLAALLILAYDPVALFSVSFQLSFVSIGVIILFGNRHHKIFEKRNPGKPTIYLRMKTWLLAGIIISAIALAATGPVTLYHFNQISLLGPISTLLTAPLICFWALPFGLVASALAPWLPEAAALLLKLGGLGLRGADQITAILAQVPFAFHNLPAPSPIAMAFYYLVGAGLLFLKAPSTIKAGLAAGMIILVTCPGQIFSWSNGETPTMISVIDVGQGSSTLIELPDGKKFLVDGGGSSSPSFDPGEKLIARFLWHRSIYRLDGLVISHQHQDHYNGLEFIIRNFRPRVIWTNARRSGPGDYLKLLETAEKLGAEIRIPPPDSSLAEGGDARISAIGGLHLREAPPDLSYNNISLAVKLESGGRKIILPGDMMAVDGVTLIREGEDLSCDLLLAPHHGSGNSAGYQLVEAGRPKWLVVSSGIFQSDSFPDPDFADWCRKRGTEILETADYGTLTFAIEADGKTSWQAVSEKGREKLNIIPR